jgi:hypothetical protein
MTLKDERYIVALYQRESYTRSYPARRETGSLGDTHPEGAGFAVTIPCGVVRSHSIRNTRSYPARRVMPDHEPPGRAL